MEIHRKRRIYGATNPEIRSRHGSKIHFNKEFRGLLDFLQTAGVHLNAYALNDFAELYEERVGQSRRHSLLNVKIVRKK